MNTLWQDTPEKIEGSKNNEWYTPSRYVEAAREVMGGIELDPASCAEANQVVKATRYYTQKDNGLAQDWTAESVWLNPPFGRKDAAANGFGGGKTIMGIFIKKLIQEYHDGNIKQAILLATPKTDASWFPWLWEFPVCFASKRVIFTRPGEEPQGHFFGTIFVYLGPNESYFIDVFRKFGRIVRAIDAPQAKPITPELWQLDTVAS